MNAREQAVLDAARKLVVWVCVDPCGDVQRDWRELDHAILLMDYEEQREKP